MSFSIYEDEPIKLKGDEKFSPITAYENLTPVFAYDYISLNQTEFCFDNTNISVDYFIQYFKTVKELGSQSIKDTEKKPGNHYHFHPVPYDRFIKNGQHKRLIIKELLDGIPEINKSHADPYNKYPTVFQFCIHPGTPSPEPRIFFFLGNRGVFYLMFFDRKHLIYPDK